MASRTFSVKITGDSKDLKRAFGDAQTSAKKFDQDLVNFGKKGALALAGVAAASTKLASDFENSMSKMVGLVGLADDEVAGFRDQILSLAGETAQAPQELADAMFFITSAGLRGSDALDALEASAKGSAAGLGATQDVALAAVSAVNAYGSENLNAAQAVDILTNTIRQGNVEASEVASTLGSVIPVASELGIGFDEVGAAIASMTRLGSNAAESTTALTAIMTTLIQPTAEAEQKLGEVGLSIAQLREQAGSGGLLPVLTSLKTAFDGNVESMGSVFGNVRALRGVMALTGESADITRQIFDELENSTGILGEAFGAVADDEGFKLKQAFNDLKVELTEIGENVLPKVASVLSDNREEIGDTAESIGDMTVSLIDLLAALEPFIDFLPDAADGMNIVANSAVNVGAGLARLAVEAVAPWKDEWIDATAAVADNAAANNRLIGALRDTEKGLASGRDASQVFAEELAELAADKGPLLERALDRLSTEAGLNEEQTIAATEAVIAWGEENGVAAEDLALLRRQVSELRGEVRTATPEQEELADKILQTGIRAGEAAPLAGDLAGELSGIGGTKQGIEDVTAAIKEQQDEIRKATDPVFALRDANEEYADALEALEEDPSVAATQDAIEARQDLEFAQQNVNEVLGDGLDIIGETGLRADIEAERIRNYKDAILELNAAILGLPTVVTLPQVREGGLPGGLSLRELEEALRRREAGQR